MFAVIYDDYDLSKPEKEVLSIHKTRATAQNALMERQRKLGKRVWECHARVVWLQDRVQPGDKVTADTFDTWAPDEEIPEGDRVPEVD